MSTYIAEHLLFSIFPSILTFYYDPIDGPFLAFLGPNGPNMLSVGFGWSLSTVLWPTHIVEYLLFSMFPWIITFEFDLILGWFLAFWARIWAILGVEVGFWICFGVYWYRPKTFVFWSLLNSYCITRFLSLWNFWHTRRHAETRRHGDTEKPDKVR